MPASFEQFVLMWLSTVAVVGLKDSGYQEYQRICVNHLLPAFGDRPVDAITAEAIQSYVADKVASGLAPRTVANHLHVLRRILDQAVRYGLTVGNAATMVTPPRVERTEMRFLVPTEIQRLIEATAPSWRLLVAMAALTGLRKGEQLALLAFHDIDIEKRVIRVSKSMRNGILHTTKTSSSVGVVPLPASLIPLVESRRSRLSTRDALLFCRADGSPLPDALPNRILAAALSCAGLPQVRWHDLRHSWCVAHLQAGTDVPTLVRLGRWASADVLLSTYAHLLPAAGGDAVQRVDALVDAQTE